jgi:CRISPR-associated protein Cst1
MEATQTINIEWLTRITGDPFADAGGMVIKTLMREKNVQDITKLITEVTDIYVKDWGSSLHSIFHGSKITNPSIKTDKARIEGTLSYFKSLLNETAEHIDGRCRVLGERTKLFRAGRESMILVGSGSFINFHHAFDNGLMLSKEAIIRIFFMPLACIQISGKVGLLESNDYEVSEFFTVLNVTENLRRSATKIADGLLKSEFNNPSSALFDFALRWINNAKKYAIEKHVELNFYNFSNFGNKTDIAIYNFSAALFKFYALVQTRTLESDWRKFSHSYFYQKNAAYQYESDTFEITEKKETDTLGYDDFKTWRNGLYQSLLDGKSILKPMLNWVAKKRRPLNFEIVKLYQIILRDMNEKTLQIIQRIADYVLRDSSNIKKNLRNLQKPQKAHAFRTALRRLEEKNLAEKNPDTLFSLEEYALELFPDGTYWQEIQDLLLIAIYQKMHEQQIWLDNEDLLIEESEEETINS